MATRNIVPRTDEEGGIGTAEKRWKEGHFASVETSEVHSTAGTGVTAITVVQYTGDTATNTASVLDASGNTTFPGTLTASKVYNAVYNDYAELFEKGEETEPGDIIALDSTSDTERYVKATRSSKVIVGVHSGEFAQIIGGKEKSLEENLQSHIPVGLAGRVYVKVEGDVHPGDNIGPGNTPGIGVKTTSGPVVGIALTEPQDGKVRILIRIGEITC